MSYAFSFVDIKEKIICMSCIHLLVVCSAPLCTIFFFNRILYILLSIADHISQMGRIHLHIGLINMFHIALVNVLSSFMFYKVLSWIKPISLFVIMASLLACAVG